MTETGPTVFLITKEDALRKAGSVGKPVMHTDVRILDRARLPGFLEEIVLVANINLLGVVDQQVAGHCVELDVVITGGDPGDLSDLERDHRAEGLPEVVAPPDAGGSPLTRSRTTPRRITRAKPVIIDAPYNGRPRLTGRPQTRAIYGPSCRIIYE